jgi:hypothetical protein
MAVQCALSRHAIARFLRPQSVAIIGASDKPGALGAALLGNLERNGFAGAIYPVNPRRDEIGGRKCYASVEALPDGWTWRSSRFRGPGCSMRCGGWPRARWAAW